MEQNNGWKLDKNFVVAVIAIAVGAVVTIATPELRKLFCLEEEKIEQQHVDEQKPPVGPFSATLHENQPQFIEEAETRLSITFNEEYKIVTLTIAPDGKQTANRAVENGYTEEFTSSTGSFLVNILNADWKKRTVTVQVSRKSSIKSAEKL